MAEEAIEEIAALPPWSRTFCGYHERFVLPFTLSVSSQSLKVQQAPCASDGHARESSGSSDAMCTGSTVWDAGIVLAAFLVGTSFASDVFGPGQTWTCLELGSGTGLAGVAAAASGVFSKVLLTDLTTVVPLVRQNIKLNEGLYPVQSVVDAVSLRWDSAEDLQNILQEGPFDIILGSDLLYRMPVVEPLLNALKSIAGTSTKVLLAASVGHSPETVKEFCTRAAEYFTVDRLPISMQYPQYTSPEVQLLLLSCKGKLDSHREHHASKNVSNRSGKHRCQRNKRHSMERKLSS